MNYLAHFLIPLLFRVFTLLYSADPSEILITFYSLLFGSLLHLTPPSLHTPWPHDTVLERNANKFALHLTREEACWQFEKGN